MQIHQSAPAGPAVEPPTRRPASPDVDLSIVVPAYNESGRLPGTLAALHAWARDRTEAIEVLVIDDGSTDDTHVVAQQALLKPRVIRLPENQGKGAAVRAGVVASRGRYVLVMDADLSTPLTEVDHLWGVMQRGYEIAIASRALATSRITLPQPFHRRVMGRVFNALVRALVLPGIHDSQCGFKLFRGDIARRVFRQSRIDGFAFDVEVLALASRAGARIAEVPVEWGDSPASRVQPMRDPARMVLQLLEIRRTAAVRVRTMRP